MIDGSKQLICLVIAALFAVCPVRARASLGDHWRDFLSKEVNNFLLKGELDSLLEKYFNLQIKDCEFIDQSDHHTLHSPDLGRCLARAFVQGIHSDNFPGPVIATILLPSSQTTQVEIDWRPGEGGFFQTLSRIIKFDRNQPDPAAMDSVAGLFILHFLDTTSSRQVLGPLGKVTTDGQIDDIEINIGPARQNPAAPGSVYTVRALLYMVGAEDPSYVYDAQLDQQNGISSWRLVGQLKSVPTPNQEAHP